MMKTSRQYANHLGDKIIWGIIFRFVYLTWCLILFLFQVFNEINSRDIEKINVFQGIFSSKIFVAVIVSTVTFQVIIVEFLGTFASTVPLSWQLWLLSVLIGAVSVPVAVVVKCIPVHRRAAEHHDGYDALSTGPELT